MFLKIIRLISVCAICLYLWTISNNREVSAGYYEQYLFLMNYTKLRRERNDLIMLYDVFCRCSSPVFLALLLPCFLLLPLGHLLLSRCFSILRLVRPVLYNHHNYSYDHETERLNFSVLNLALIRQDDLLQLASLLAIVLLGFHVIFSPSVTIDLARLRMLGKTVDTARLPSSDQKSSSAKSK